MIFLKWDMSTVYKGFYVDFLHSVGYELFVALFILKLVKPPTCCVRPSLEIYGWIFVRNCSCIFQDIGGHNGATNTSLSTEKFFFKSWLLEASLGNPNCCPLFVWRWHAQTQNTSFASIPRNAQSTDCIVLLNNGMHLGTATCYDKLSDHLILFLWGIVGSSPS